MTVLYAEDLQAVGKFLSGLIELCKETKITVSGDENGITLWFEGDDIGHVGMFEDCVYSFRPRA